MKIKVRLATLEDAREILDIYTPYITNSSITFEYTVPTVDEFKNRMQLIMKKYPYIVAVCNEKIVGYAYAHEQHERAAYQWNVETSIYVNQELKHQGIGRLLYGKLLQILKVQNVQNVYACIALPNENSEKIHYAFGFDLVGRFHNTGYKFDKWNDVGWFELHIGSEPEQGILEEVLPINEIIEQVEDLLGLE